MAAEGMKTIDELLVGDVLTRSIFARNGTVLLDQNTRLTQELIGKLDRWGITSVSVREPGDPDAVSGENSSGSSGDVPSSSLTLESTARDEEPSEAFTLMLGSLESEEPIVWEEIIEKAPPPADMTKLEAEIEERLSAPPSVRRTEDLKPPEAVPFVYDKSTMREAKKVMHEVHRQTVRQVKKTFSGIASRDVDFNMDGLRRMIIQLVDNGIANRQVLSALTTLTHFDDYLLAHAVGSTVHAILTGYSMGFPQSELYELAECCLLHDIGMSRISPSAWKHPGKVTVPMQLEIQKHTVLGADILHDTKGISRHAEYVAYQHHERFDGSGYPKGRKGLGIHEYARIVALVDSYTAMTSHRPHRESILGYDTMKHILASSATLFDPMAVKAFLQNMALYPVGSLVELSNSSVAIVIAANPFFPYRPHVKLTRDEHGVETGSDGDIINLLTTRELGITRPLATDGGQREKVWKAL